MYQSEYVIAYDQGTSGLKAALITLDGALIACATEAYPLYRPAPGYAEQDPDDYWDAVCRTTVAVMKKAQANPANARGIVFCAIWKSLIPVDRDIRPLRRSLIWLDSRAVDEADEINRRIGEERYVPADYWPKLLWFYKHERHIYDACYKIIGVNTYLGWKATGELVTNISDSFIFAHSAAQQAVYDHALEGTGISKEKFVPWVESSSSIGKLHDRAAVEMGLVPGIPVFAGSGDIQAIAIGAGSGAPGKIHAYFGSSGWVGMLQEYGKPTPRISPLNQQYNVDAIGGIKASLSLNWAIDQFYHDEKEKLQDGIFTFLEEELKQIPAGSDGLLVVPSLFGGTTAQTRNERASFVRVSDKHTRAHLVHGVMEGVCMLIRSFNQERFAQQAKLGAYTIRAVGGGACNDRWMQILANVLNVPVEIPYHCRHVGTIGSAYHALIGLGLYDNYEQAAKCIRIEKTFYPQKDAVEIYEAAFAEFEALRKALYPIYNHGIRRE